MDKKPERYVATIGWGDVPHLSKEACEKMLRAFPPHEREARSLGTPMLGSGKVYPVAEDEFLIDPFQMPSYWPRCYAMDVGWRRTAAVWGAHDRDDDIIYIYSEYYQGHQPPAVHSYAIKARGENLIGCIDPAAAGASQVDGKSLINEYRKAGLKVFPANNRVTGQEGGIHNVFTRLTEGRLKIFRTCVNLIKEMRIYRRNEHGKIVKENDHLCLHGDTLVITDTGRVRIADLVGARGKILSSDGGWHAYQNCTLTGEDEPVLSVLIKDGDKLAKTVCTYDHKFLTTRGWVEAEKLQRGMNLANIVTGGNNEFALSVPAGNADVYCLNVPDTGNFAIENGVIVSNCDALRYLCMSNMQHAVKLRKGSEEDEDENVVPFRGRNKQTGY